MSAGGTNAADLLFVNPLLNRGETDVKLDGCVARFEQVFYLRRFVIAVLLHLEPNRTVAERDGSNTPERSGKDHLDIKKLADVDKKVLETLINIRKRPTLSSLWACFTPLGKQECITGQYL